MGARADAADVELEDTWAWEKAVAADRLGYARGIAGVSVVADRDAWHARYDPETRTVVAQQKLDREPRDGQKRILLHEIGHRGQEADPETYEAFKALGLDRLQDFLAIANRAHLEDFKRRGVVDGLAAETFAESYMRACLDVEQPAELREFWEERFARGRRADDAKFSKEAVGYVGPMAERPEFRRCDGCSMFRKPLACTAVEGQIDPGGYCRIHDRLLAVA